MPVSPETLQEALARAKPFIPDLVEQPPRGLASFANRLAETLKQSGLKIATGNGHHDQSIASVDNLYEGVFHVVKQATAEFQIPDATGETQYQLGPDTYRMSKYAPKILQALLDANVAESLPLESALHLSFIACQLAKNPKDAALMNITTGFGGSESQTISLRTISHMLPALRAWENLASVLQEMGVDQRPRLRLFWAPHAAITLNGMNPEQVMKNVSEQMLLIKRFLDEFSPEASQYVIFEIDLPWEEHDPATKAVLDYYTSLALDPDDEAAAKAMNNLVRRGQNHDANGTNANGKAREAAARYAAYHPAIFNDPQVLNTRVFPDASTTQVLYEIVYGPRAERQFTLVRHYIAHTASHAEFTNFLQRQGRLHQAETLSQNGADDPNAVQLPISSAMLFSPVGKHSLGYYPTKYDIPIGPEKAVSIADTLAILEEMKRKLNRIGKKKADIEELSREERLLLGLSNQDNLGSKDAKLLYAKVKSVLQDYQMLAQFTGGADRLQQFYCQASYTSNPPSLAET